MEIESNELKLWADGRETSDEIAEAIFSLATDLSHAQRIWEDPADDEYFKVCAICAGNVPDGTKLFWGEETLITE